MIIESEEIKSIYALKACYLFKEKYNTISVKVKEPAIYSHRYHQNANFEKLTSSRK